MLVVAGEVEVKDTYIRPFTSMWCIGWDCKTLVLRLAILTRARRRIYWYCRVWQKCHFLKTTTSCDKESDLNKIDNAYIRNLL